MSLDRLSDKVLAHTRPQTSPPSEVHQTKTRNGAGHADENEGEC